MADVTQIHLPTRATQLEILDKVEFASFMVDVDKQPYLPEMKEVITTGYNQQWNGDTIGVVDNTHIYAFRGGLIRKYNKKTLRLIQEKTYNTGNGTIFINHRDRLFVDVGDYIYAVNTQSGNHSIVKIDKATLTFTLGPSYAASTYGMAKRLFIVDEFIYVVTEAQGAWKIPLSTLNIIGAKKFYPNNPVIDAIYGGANDPYLYMASRLDGTGVLYLLRYNLDGTIDGAYQHPTDKPSNNNGYFLPIMDNYLTLFTDSYVFRIYTKSLVTERMIGVYTRPQGSFPYYENGNIYSFQISDVETIMHIYDFGGNKSIGIVPMTEGFKTSTINYHKGDKIIIGNMIPAVAQEFGTIAYLETAYEIRNYRKVVIE